MSVLHLSVGQVQATRRLRTLVLLGCALALAVISGLLLGVVDPAREPALLGALLLLPLPLLFWRVPVSAVLVPTAFALLVEQFGTGLADQLTDRLQLFRTLNTSAGLGGILVSPAEIVIATGALTLMIRGVARRDIRVWRSALSRGLAALLLVALLSMLHGRATGGDFQIMVDEVRPFLYVGALYLMASQVVRTPDGVWALLWLDVLATGFKGVQGTYRFIALQNIEPPPEAILGHDEAVFFSLFILLTVGLWLFGIRGRLRIVATALLPFVVTADLANQRRAAWIILPVGIVLLLVASWVASRERRRRTVAVAALVAVGSAIYLPLFWNSQSTIAQPARGIRSAFDPNARDEASDVYRQIERIDLGIDIKASTPFGYGFGRPLPHPVPLPYDAASSDPLINYVPHNSTLWLWARMGIPGALAFWFVIGAATVLACRVARNADRRLSLAGAFGLCTIGAYVIEGWFDQGQSQYRTAVVVGCVLGCLQAISRLGEDG